MPEAKFQIKRKCEVCGNTFIAKTLDSRYCCRHCTDIAYKNRKAAKAKEEQQNQIAQLIPGEREFISVKEAVAMYAISRDTIYRLIRKGRLPYINIGLGTMSMHPKRKSTTCINRFKQTKYEKEVIKHKSNR